MSRSSSHRGSTEFLSATARDYYKRYGRKSGIEKFFRNVDPSLLTRASSESSLQSIRDDDNVADRLATAKSCYSSLDRTVYEIEPNQIATPPTPEEEKVEVTSDQQESSLDASERDQASLEPVVSEKEELSQKDNEVQEILVVSNVEEKQTINLNIHSNVEIKLPDQYLHQQQMHLQRSKSTTDLVSPEPQEPFRPPPETPAPAPPSHVQAFYPTYIFPPVAHYTQALQPAPHQRVVYSTDTQTMPESPQKTMYSSETQTTYSRTIKPAPSDLIEEEPIKPTLTTRIDVPPVVVENIPRDVSPVSSVALEQKLEWDSWGDIGYNSNSSNTYQACAASDLNETEKQAVNRYCSERGIEYIPRDIIVVRNAPKNKAGVDKLDDPSQPEAAVKKRALDRKEKWQQIYNKYKDKYHETSSQTTLHLSNPNAQSTPKLETVKITAVDCSVQTSHIDLLCKSIQVETDIDESKMSTELRSDNTCNDSSFVFVKPPNPPDKNSSSKGRHKKRSSCTATDTQVDSTKSSSRRSNNLDGSFENELKMAIALMNSVLESKSLHVALKKSLVVKIMQKIMNLKLQQDFKRRSFSKESDKGSLSDVSTLKSSKSSMVSRLFSFILNFHFNTEKTTI